MHSALKKARWRFLPRLVSWLLQRGGAYRTALLALRIIWLVAQFGLIAFTALLLRDQPA